MAEGTSDQVTKLQRQQLLVTGIVQGVGFRPFIYRIANEEQLRGFVRNTSKGVEIELEGSDIQITNFRQRMLNELPPLAVIDSIDINLDEHNSILEMDNHTIITNSGKHNIVAQNDEPNDEQVFRIISSHVQVKGKIKLPADIAICEACKQEILTPSDRHYYYPLTNCTNCGPRFTVIRDVPYDRQMTTMQPFPMCDACEREYNEPADRRFHAQPTACPICGPNTKLIDCDGNVIAVGNSSDSLVKLLAKAASLLNEGKIIAIKGIGGFHFACDADNAVAVKLLRERKRRPFKPLAVMAQDINAVKERTKLSQAEQEILESHQAPIVILDKQDQRLFGDVAPGMHTVGVMLPYTPLHVLLFASGCPTWLVMTSANQSNMPTTIDNEQAIDELHEFVDYIIIHDRAIEQPCDDSLVRVQNDEPTLIRRGRGYTPTIIKLPMNADSIALAVGGEMKNAFAYVKGNEAIISQHIGEIDSWEGRRHFLHTIGHFERLYDLEPDIVAYDMHPSYQVSEIARLLQYNRKIEVQHHHAHMASCMAEHGLTGTTLGIILDGTGYGDNGSLWGFEFLVGDYLNYRRIAYGYPLPVVSGDMAIKQPWRMAVSVLYLLDSQNGLQLARRLWPDKENEIKLLGQLLEKNLQVINSSGAGRLFDAVAALLKLCEISSYEGEAAIRLENSAISYLRRQPDTLSTSLNIATNTLISISSKSVPTSIIYNDRVYDVDYVTNDSGQTVLDWRPMLRQIIQDIVGNVAIDEIAFAFHVAVAKAIINQALKIINENFEQSQIKQVVLSGGTWHNELLLQLVKNELRQQGLAVYCHKMIPTNDGGIALGQAAIAVAKCNKDK